LMIIKQTPPLMVMVEELIPGIRLPYAGGECRGRKNRPPAGG
jgi:hypothetical protein